MSDTLTRSCRPATGRWSSMTFCGIASSRCRPNARELLSIVSVAGQRIALRHVLDASADARDHLQALAQLRAEHFIRRSGPTLDDDVETWHDRVRETVASRLPAQTIRTLHAGPCNDARRCRAFRFRDDRATLRRRGRRRECGSILCARRERIRGGPGVRSRGTPVSPGAAMGRTHTGRARRVVPSRIRSSARECRPWVRRRAGYETAIKSLPESERFELEALAAQQYCVSGHVTAGRAIFRRLLDRAGIPMPSHQRSPWRRCWDDGCNSAFAG